MSAPIYPAVPPALPPERRRARVVLSDAFRMGRGPGGIWIEAEAMIGPVRIIGIRASRRAVVWPRRHGGEAAVVVEDEALRREVEAAVRRLLREEIERRRLPAGRMPA